MATRNPNQPCPCGSGKKYKKCCMQHDQARDAATATDAHAAQRPKSSVKVPLDDAGYRYVPAVVAYFDYGVPLFESFTEEEKADDRSSLISAISELGQEFWNMAAQHQADGTWPEPSQRLAELISRAHDAEALYEMMAARARLMYPEFPHIDEKGLTRQLMVDLPMDWSPPDEHALLGGKPQRVPNAARLARMHEQVFDILSARRNSDEEYNRAEKVILKIIDAFRAWLTEKGVPEESIEPIATTAVNFYFHEALSSTPLDDAPPEHIERFLLNNLFRTPMMDPLEHAHAGSALILLGEFLEEIEVGDGLKMMFHDYVARIRIELSLSIVRFHGMLPTSGNLEFFRSMQEKAQEVGEEMFQLQSAEIPDVHAQLVELGTFIGMSQYIDTFEELIADLRDEYEPFEQKAFPDHYAKAQRDKDAQAETDEA